MGNGGAAVDWVHGCDVQTFMIYIDDTRDGVPGGRYEDPTLAQSGTFRDLAQLMLRLDACLDVGEGPQAFCAARGFAGVWGIWPEESVPASARRGKVATFALQIRFRRNASWQGTVRWMDRGQTRHFRSVLELMTMIHGVVEDHRMDLPILSGLPEAE